VRLTLIESVAQKTQAFHLAGVVPVASQPLDFGFPWHDSLMPIGKNYLAVERAVLECAWAGCETIWVVCHRDMQPIIKERLGEWIQDPNWLLQKELYPSNVQRRLPIYYVPIHPKDRDRRDCLGWSVLYGALSAYHISRKISKWVIPDKYYCAFPYGVYDPSQIRKQRKNISSNRSFFLTSQGKSVKNGEYLGFTFDGEDFKTCRRELRKEGTPGSDDKTGRMLPPEKRWSARFFSLDKVFKYVIMNKESGHEIDGYHKIDSWEDYTRFISSGETYEKPEFFKPRKWNRVGDASE
jgi:hypothetical protein